MRRARIPGQRVRYNLYQGHLRRDRTTWSPGVAALARWPPADGADGRMSERE
jgi:hypothetical protein